MNINKNFVLVLLALFNTAIYSQWYAQQSGTNYALKSVYFTDINTGYACGYNTVLKTTNSGVNWMNYTQHGNHQAITFTDANTGYLASDSGKIFKTTNSGANWIAQSTATVNNLTTVNFYNSNTGIAAGQGKTIIKTTNGGSNWFSVSSIIWEVDFLSSEIIDENNYYVTGTDSYIIRTTNGGANWISYTMGEVNPLFTVEFINDNTGFATGCCGMFLSTTNGGVNWTDHFYLSLGFTFHSLKFMNSVTGFCSGSNGMMYRSTNGGMSWDSTVTITDETLYSVQMVNNSTGWAVGGYGTILKTTNSGGPGFPIGIEPVSEVIPQEFLLYQNYPNPFNPNTKIKFDVMANGRREKSKINLIVYNLLGKQVAELVNTELVPGKYEVGFESSSLPSGIYYYRLSSSDFTETRKMVLLK